MNADAVGRLGAALEGRYRIEGELGEGGMATVFLADDLKHGRKVALKVLKPELAAVVGAERFLGEIRTTANLQHPHVLPLFDSGEADGFLFFVMPYMEGETLRQRLDRDRQLPVDEAVHVAVAVANAVDHAHRHGVVHRDIKPANILLQEGEPVVADFGIALAVNAAGGNRLTETGLSLGTPYYMSPEQATGDQPVGAASDIYSLGCVLYEMLVGEPPHYGSTTQAVLGRIIAGNPVDPRQHRPSIPLHVDAAVRRALEKLPADRFTSARDFAQALTDPSFRHGVEVAVPGAGPTRGWTPVALAGWALAAVLATSLGWRALRPEAPAGVERYSLAAPDAWGPSGQMSVAADGSAVAFIGQVEGTSHVFLRRMEDLTASPVPGTDGATWPALSHDGQEVAYLEGGELRVAPLIGGVARTLTDSVFCCTWWGPDDFIYYSAPPDFTIARIPATGGAVERITEGADQDGNHAWFRLVKGGDVGVFTNYASPWRVEAVRISTGERRVLTPGLSPLPLPSGDLAFLDETGVLMVAPFDEEALSLAGTPVPVADGVQIGGNGVPMLAGSDAGTVVYWTGVPASTEFEMLWVSRRGEFGAVDPGWTFDADDDNRGWDLSPDGRLLALKARTDLGRDIWIKELPDGPMSRLTYADEEERFPRWSPDGRVTFLSSRSGNLDVWIRSADGAGEAELVWDGDSSVAEASWSPDGEWLVMRTSGIAGTVGGRDIVGLRPGLDSVPRPLVATGFDEAAPTVSPNGRWLAYHSDETGRREVFIRPFPDTDGRKIQVSDGGGRAPVWSHAGTELFYLSGDGTTSGDRTLMAAELRPGPPLAVVSRRQLFAVPDGFYFANNSTSYLVAPDDERFLIARMAGSGNDEARSELILIRNFYEEIRRRTGR